MPLPTTKEGLEAKGYVFKEEGPCKYCGQTIEFWITNNDKIMPMKVHEVKDTSKPFPQPVLRHERIPHFADCEEYPSNKTRKAKDNEK